MLLVKEMKTLQSHHGILVTNLRNLLAEQKISETELSRRTRIPQPTLHKIFAHKTIDPRISTLQSLANYFNLSVDSLYSNGPLKSGAPFIKNRPIPMISWADCVKSKNPVKSLNTHNWKHWVVIESHTSNIIYALKTKASMEPRFPRDTILIVDAEKKCSDGELVIVRYPNTSEATLRQFSSDGPTQLLFSMNDSAAKPDKLDKSMQILGVVIQSRFLH